MLKMYLIYILNFNVNRMLYRFACKKVSPILLRKKYAHGLVEQLVVHGGLLQAVFGVAG